MRLAADCPPSAGYRRDRSSRGSCCRACPGPPGSDRSDLPFDRPDLHAVHRRTRPVDRPGRAEQIQHRLVQRANTSASTHSVNRRCAVGVLTPNDAGSADQAHPVRSTYRIAASTTRSSRRRRPAHWWRCGASGSSGCASSHNDSGHHFSTSSIVDQRYRLPRNTPKRDAVIAPAARPASRAPRRRRTAPRSTASTPNARRRRRALDAGPAAGQPRMRSARCTARVSLVIRSAETFQVVPTGSSVSTTMILRSLCP